MNQLASKKGLKNKENFGYLFVAPFFIVFLTFGLYPIIKTMSLAFFKYDMHIPTDTFIGLDYIRRALVDATFYTSLFTSFKLWFLTYAFEVSSAMIIAALFTFVKIRGMHFYKSAFYVPNLVSGAAVAILFSLFMGYPFGLFNELLMKIGIIAEPITFKQNVLALQVVVIIIGWWMNFGRTSIIASAGMTSISNEYYEAARVDGAKTRQIFAYITVPLMRPILLFMFITSLIGGLQMFDIPFLLTNTSAGGPMGAVQTVSMYIYMQGFEAGNIGYSAALSILLFIFIVFLSVITTFVLRERKKKVKV